ncbi:hypothetical protein K1719_013775 [Acacia pycnantha]|nr:hypothetical protein K1719_013775 [Acacia pycnantha]
MCYSLLTIDLSSNSFIGRIPSSLANCSVLSEPDLSNNYLSGAIPNSLVLDLGENDLSGSIPASFGDLKALTPKKRKGRIIEYTAYPDPYNRTAFIVVENNYQNRLIVNAKGQSLMYTKTLSLVTSIDLSGNNLSGIFPREMTKLSGLVCLNLSRKHISGSIPLSVSNMHQLSSLDLSSNQLPGAIPYTGQTTTFEASSFAGNPGLYGCPLPVRFLRKNDNPGHGSDDGGSNDETNYGGGDDGLVDKWFYLSLGVGFAAGLLIPYFILSLKRSWSEAYFDLLEGVVIRFLVFLHRRRISHGRYIKPRHRQ